MQTQGRLFGCACLLFLQCGKPCEVVIQTGKKQGVPATHSQKQGRGNVLLLQATENRWGQAILLISDRKEEMIIGQRMGSLIFYLADIGAGARGGSCLTIGWRSPGGGWRRQFIAIRLSTAWLMGRMNPH